MESIKRYFYVYIAIGLFLFFIWVSTMSPLVGDDWGYYINGLKGPLTMTMEFYQTWSGRVVGEFLGFVLASRHEWWIYLFNPLVFSGTFSTIFLDIQPVSSSKRALEPGLIHMTKNAIVVAIVLRIKIKSNFLN